MRIETQVVNEKHSLLAQETIDHRTHALLIGLQQCKTDASRLVRLEEFCKHMLYYPETKNKAVKV